MHNGGGKPVEATIDVPSTPLILAEARAAQTKAALAAAGTRSNTIIVNAPPGHNSFNSEEEEEENLPKPTYADTPMTDAEKLNAVKRWSLNRKKHEKKKRSKLSFVGFTILQFIRHLPSYSLY